MPPCIHNIKKYVIFCLNFIITLINFSCNRYQALGVYDSKEKLAGIAIFANYPNMSSISPCDWEEWVYNLYGLKDVNSRNTIWIHVLLYERNYYNFFLTPIMQFIFKNNYMVRYCIMVVPPGKHNTDFLNNLGIPVLPRTGEYIHTIFLLS